MSSMFGMADEEDVESTLRLFILPDRPPVPAEPDASSPPCAAASGMSGIEPAEAIPLALRLELV